MGIAANRFSVSPRRVLVAAALGVAFVLPGCATKKDVRTLQMAIADMQAHQDSVLRNIERQNRLMLDTLRSSMAMTLDSRGQTSFRLQEVTGLLEATKQLVGQNLQAMQQLSARIDAMEARAQSASAAQPQPVQSAPSGMTAVQSYQAGMAKMKEGSYGSARAYFSSIVRSFRDDPIAPDAQFQIGESWVFEESWEDAYRAFDEVASSWPASSRAGEALYRAGRVAEDRKDNANARKYYTKVTQLYPTSPQAKLAQTALRRIPR